MSSEYESCIIVYDNIRKHFILAKIRPKNISDAVMTNNITT